MTLYEYIHEYDTHDDMLLSAHNLTRESVASLYQYEKDIRMVEKKVMFENADYDVYMESANENFFVRLGKAIAKVITTIAKFIQDTLDRFLNGKKIKAREENLAKVNAYLSQNPGEKDTIIQSIKDGNASLKDIAAFSKDYESTLKLIERMDADENTIKNAVDKTCDKIEKSPPIRIAKTLGTIGAAVGAVTGLFVIVANGINLYKDTKTSSENLQKQIELGFDIVRRSPNSAADGSPDTKSMERTIKRYQNADPKLLAAKTNGISTLITKFTPVYKAYIAQGVVVDRAIENFARRCDMDKWQKSQSNTSTP